MRTRIAVLGLGVLAVAVVAVRPQEGPAYDGPVALVGPSASPQAVTEHDWLAVVRMLDEKRLAGYADPAGADPLTWVTPDCPCLLAEQDALRRLAEQGRRLVVDPPDVVSAVAVAAADLAATIEVRDVLAAYDEIDGRGRSVRVWPGRGEASWLATLVRHEGGWRWASWERQVGHDDDAGVDPERPG